MKVSKVPGLISQAHVQQKLCMSTMFFLLFPECQQGNQHKGKNHEYSFRNDDLKSLPMVYNVGNAG
jgi:hypothetical protein